MLLVLAILGCSGECAPGFEHHGADANCYPADDAPADDTAAVEDDTGAVDDDTGADDDTDAPDTGEADTDRDDSAAPVDADGDGYAADVDCDDGDAGRFPGPGADELDVADADCDGFFFDPDIDGRLWLGLLSGGTIELGAYPNMLTGAYRADLTAWSIKDYAGSESGAQPPGYRVVREATSGSPALTGPREALEVDGHGGNFCLDTTAWVQVGRPLILSRVIQNVGDAPVRLTERFLWGSGGAGATYELPELAPGEAIDLPSMAVTAYESALTVSICSDGGAPFRLFEPGLWHAVD